MLFSGLRQPTGGTKLWPGLQCQKVPGWTCSHNVLPSPSKGTAKRLWLCRKGAQCFGVGGGNVVPGPSLGCLRTSSRDGNRRVDLIVPSVVHNALGFRSVLLPRTWLSPPSRRSRPPSFPRHRDLTLFLPPDLPRASAALPLAWLQESAARPG